MPFHAVSVAVVVAVATMMFESEARAVMGTPTIISRIDKNGDGKLSLAELRAAAAKKYDLIQSKNGDNVTLLALGGRVSNKDLQAIGLPPGLSTHVSKQQYLALVDRFFDEANVRKPANESPGQGNLDAGELMSKAGKNLIGLVE